MFYVKVMSRKELKFLANNESHLKMTKDFWRYFSHLQMTFAISREIYFKAGISGRLEL
jgi:hypothetical protein